MRDIRNNDLITRFTENDEWFAGRHLGEVTVQLAVVFVVADVDSSPGLSEGLVGVSLLLQGGHLRPGGEIFVDAHFQVVSDHLAAFRGALVAFDGQTRVLNHVPQRGLILLVPIGFRALGLEKKKQKILDRLAPIIARALA